MNKILLFRPYMNINYMHWNKAVLYLGRRIR